MYDQKTMTTYVSWKTGILKSLPHFMHFYANNYFFLFFLFNRLALSYNIKINEEYYRYWIINWIITVNLFT